MTHLNKLRSVTAALSAALLAGVASTAEANPDRPKLDTNGDGSVDLAEFQAARPDFTVEKFNEADQNDDGLLSRDELRQAHGRARFERLDKDGNGSVSLEEIKAVKPDMTAERFGKLDANGDGQVSHEEMRAAHQERHRHHGERKDGQPQEG